jgi:gliding motility-associated lipoprotein GldH
MQIKIKFFDSVVARFSVFILASFIFVSCGNGVMYQKYVDYSDKGMSMADTVDFDFVVENPNEKFNLILNLEYLKTYPYQNVFFFVDILGPEDLYYRDTIECILANPSGKWLGDVSGELVNQDLMYRYNTYFPAKGAYKIKVQHAMRDSVLVAMRSFRIELREFEIE